MLPAEVIGLGVSPLEVVNVGLPLMSIKASMPSFFDCATPKATPAVLVFVEGSPQGPNVTAIPKPSPEDLLPLKADALSLKIFKLGVIKSPDTLSFLGSQLCSGPS